MEQACLTTRRLLLRPFRNDDAAAVQQLAGDREIADTTENIPHPYEDGMAEAWIATHGEHFRDGSNVVFAVELTASNRLIGACGMRLEQRHRKSELGYWIGKPFWGEGYATEAAAGVVNYGFETLSLNNISARHLSRNPASGRVMQKLGMRHVATLREDTIKWGKFEDIELYCVLRKEWESS